MNVRFADTCTVPDTLTISLHQASIKLLIAIPGHVPKTEPIERRGCDAMRDLSLKAVLVTGSKKYKS
jgi:hypothetical protein